MPQYPISKRKCHSQANESNDMIQSRSTPRLWAFVILLLLIGVELPSACAQPVAPPRPKEYRVQIRYRIRGSGNVRIAQFLALTRYLESVGFHKDPGPENEAEDPEQTRMFGTINSGNVRKLLIERHVQAILLTPPGYELPAERDT